MKKLFPLCAVLMLLGVPVQAALPLGHDDYMKAEDARFNAADKNHNGVLDKDEVAGAFQGGELQPSAATQEACMKSGRQMAASFTPPKNPQGDPNFHPLAKKDFMEARQGMFEQADANHDHTVTQEEMGAMDQRMAKMCAAAPAMMDQVQAMQGMGLNGNKPSPEQMRAMMEKMKAMQGQLPPGMAPPPPGMPPQPQMPPPPPGGAYGGGE